MYPIPTIPTPSMNQCPIVSSRMAPRLVGNSKSMLPAHLTINTCLSPMPGIRNTPKATPKGNSRTPTGKGRIKGTAPRILGNMNMKLTTPTRKRKDKPPIPAHSFTSLLKNPSFEVIVGMRLANKEST